MMYAMDILIINNQGVPSSEKIFYKDREIMFDAYRNFVEYLENEYYKGRIKEFDVSIDIIAIE